MSQNSKLAKFIPPLCIALAVLYFICQAVSIAGSAVQTEYAVMVSYDDCISAQAYFAREEVIVSGKSGGSVMLKVDNGEKLAKSDIIAVYYDNPEQIEIGNRVNELENQIEDYTYVIAQAVNKRDTSKIEAEIINLNSSVASAVRNGFVSECSDDVETLKSLIVRRGLIYGNLSDIEARLNDLTAEKNALNSRLTGHREEIIAAQSGYFCTETDGYENILSPKSLSTMTTEQFLNLPNIAGTVPENAIGRIATNFEWYAAVRLPTEQAEKIIERFSVSKRLKIKINSINSETSVYLDSRRFLGEGYTMLVFRGTDVSAELLGVRSSNIDIILKTYTGIKIPKNALRQVDDVWGVYCRSGQRLIFKPVDILFETDTYYIAKSEGLSSKDVYIYDEIVVSGKELSKNQVIE